MSMLGLRGGGCWPIAGSSTTPVPLTYLLSRGICTTDDHRHRVLIDPKTNTAVRRYGVDDISGAALGPLNTSDGFDRLAPDGITPTQRRTG